LEYDEVSEGLGAGFPVDGEDGGVGATVGVGGGGVEAIIAGVCR